MEKSGAGNQESVEEEQVPRNKVAELIDKYDLTGLATELEEGWTATGDAHRSLRELAEYFNRQILEQEFVNTGKQTLRGETETFYTLLTSEDVSEGDRVRARRRLEEQGIDVDELVDDFVSYQTVRRYLKNHRGATYTRAESDRLETEAQNIQQLSGRVEAVAENKLQSLRDSSRLSLGEFRVTTDVHVYCEDCETRYSATGILSRGGCDCDLHD